jgi:DNA polymerase I
MPAWILDLFVEFRNLTNGLRRKQRHSLLDAMLYFGLDCIGAAEKDEMRQLALRGGEYTAAEHLALLDYCQSDVDCLVALLPRIALLIEGRSNHSYRAGTVGGSIGGV